MTIHITHENQQLMLRAGHRNLTRAAERLIGELDAMQSAQASVTGVTFDADAFVATSSLPEATRRLLDGARDIARHSGPPRAEDVRAALARLSDGEAPEPAPGKRRRNDFFASIDMASNATR